MGSVGAPELLVVFLVALIVLGPERLPKMARQMGRAVAEFKRVTSGFEQEVRRAIDEVDQSSSSASSASTTAESSTASVDRVDHADQTATDHDGNGVLPPPDDPSQSHPDRPVARPRAKVSPDDLPPPPDDPSRN